MTPPPDEAVARFSAELDRLLGSPAGAAGGLGLAVSGGADSMALLLLAHAARPGAIAAATVDHGLRPEAATEAASVAESCARLGVPHHTLAAQVAPGASGLQAAAREARYAALGGWRQALGLAALATAHHADDQAETMLMRLARGSGVGGMRGIQERRALGRGGGWLVRPLLGFRRAELRAIATHAGVRFFDDPSNAARRFDRARVRASLGGAEWLDPLRLAATARHMADAEAALAWAAARAVEERVSAAADGWTVDPEGLPAEILRRVVLAVLARVTAAAESGPAGPALDRFVAALAAGRVATLAGVRASGGAAWHFAPAPPRR